MFQSIRWRLVASYVLLTVLSVTVVGLLASEIVRQYIQQQEIKELEANAQSLAQQVLPLMWVNAPTQQIHSLAQAASFLGDVRVRILNRDEKLLTDSGLRGPAEELILIYPPEGGEHLSFQNEAWFNLIMPVMDGTFPFTGNDRSIYESLPSDTRVQFVQRSSGPWGERFSFSVDSTRGDDSFPLQHQENLNISRSAMVIREPIGDSRFPLGFVELSAGQDFGAAALRTTRRAFLLAGAGATLLAVVVGLVMSHRLTSPLHSLQETASRMGSGDLSARAKFERNDEIGDLAVQFNQMADQLEDSFSQVEAERDALRSFISDASHELRTPITALKNFITMIQGPAAEDPIIQSEFLSESQDQIERLEWITHNLLDLSRLDGGLVEMDFVNHDLGELIETAAAPFKALAEDKQICLMIELPKEPFKLRCDATRLEMVLSNLLDNAFKFTPAGGEVALGAEQTTEVTRIWVQDTGAGIDPEDLAHIFDRFYRGRHHSTPGSGLGLAIAKSLVEAQGGQIIVESTPGEGARFIVEFPIAS
ncbi:sensor histidine kinase [Chloroflexota bacterium]